MGVGPQKRMVTLGVNALARETGLPRQTVSDRMRKGATPSEIRLYAAMRGHLSPERKPSAALSRRDVPGSRRSRPAFDATLNAGDMLQAINDVRLRRARALAEKQEIEDQQLRSQLIPRAYLQRWALQFLIYCRELLLMGPFELRDLLAAESDPVKCNEILSSWVRRTMDNLAQLDELWAPAPNDK